VVPLDSQVRPDRLGQLVLLVLLVSRVSKVKKELLEEPDLVDRVVSREVRALREVLDLRDKPVTLDNLVRMGQLDSPVPRDLLGSLDKQDSQDQQETPVRLVLPESKVSPVPSEHLVQQDSQVLLERPDRKA